MKLNLGSGSRTIEGYENLDKETGWFFEDGLPYEDESVKAITISHALMYVDEKVWPWLFTEFHRVLEPGGIIRITEDDTANPKSERYGGNPGDPELKTLTSPWKVKFNLEMAGFTVFKVDAKYSATHDIRMLQSWHGDPPKVFFFEGHKP